MKRSPVHTHSSAPQCSLTAIARRNRSASAARISCIGAALCLPLLFLPAAGHSAQAAAQAREQVAPRSEAIRLEHSAPYFTSAPAAGNRASLGVSYYGAAGAQPQTAEREGELLKTRSEFGEQVYIPAWYAKPQAAGIQDSAPLILRLREDAKLYLSPESGISWPASYVPSGVVSASRFGDEWYGVALEASPAYANGSVVRPALLWVRSEDVLSTQRSVSGLLAAESAVPTRIVRSLTEVWLAAGTSGEQTLALLGEPFSRTAAPFPADGEDGKNEQRGEVWRYERPDAHLTVSFGPDGRLTGWNWILPTSEAEQMNLNPAQPPYQFRYEFRDLPIAASIQARLRWQAQSELRGNSLVAATRGVLVVRGDDGLPGELHRSGQLYGLDRADGRRLWKLDAGAGETTVLADPDGAAAAVLMDADPQTGEAASVLRHVRLDDGGVRWTYKADSSGGGVKAAAAGSSILLYSQPGEQARGALSALSRSGGYVRWTKTFADPYTILNEGSDDPYVLLRQGQWIQALDPRTGRPVWSVKSDEPPAVSGETRITAATPSDPLAAPGGERWVVLGSEWVKLNEANGQITARIPYLDNERLETPGGGYLLVRRALDAASYAEGSLFETALYDTKQGRELWSVPGQAANALLGEDRLYVLLNGIPTALSLQSGEPLWRTETSGFGLAADEASSGRSESFARFGGYLLLTYGSDLLVLDAENGDLLRRVDGISFDDPKDGATSLPGARLSSDGATVYAGSANGLFTALDLAELRAGLDERRGGR
ncbi:PQQ-binding-like beta-propeller repeat protein [Saccharibacillus sp. CPCC 101409]|uniref:outer membrane protein assembly factor BamB family protein n=1 Tax=Saccharibacillus sp. CPCC 101409 TaxID=3058041 RepID=UPI0026722A00|nr:PQQ-binding-like beta-propeller repeat protein [Saccharibacillus sp. CPCC 101409]MDO3410805.1 PQQ-binding-like beta-propeller repeat protein [Saccharibacillus sp. CPCC 101409]